MLYSELKNTLKIPDGELISNLNALKEMGYLVKSKILLDNKELELYEATKKGTMELIKIINWMKMLEKLKGEKRWMK
ncbi:MAG: transcriptional regulator [Promethearchaeota archaeon]